MRRDPLPVNATDRWADIRSKKLTMDKRYEKILEMEHHTSATRKPMPLYNRAAQFSPFAALTGFEDVISQATEQQIQSFEQPDSQE